MTPKPRALFPPTLPEIKPRLGVVASTVDRARWADRVARASSVAVWHWSVADLVVPMRMGQLDVIFIPSDAVAARGVLHLLSPVPVVVGNQHLGSLLRRAGYTYLAVVEADLGAALEHALRATRRGVP